MLLRNLSSWQGEVMNRDLEVIALMHLITLRHGSSKHILLYFLFFFFFVGKHIITPTSTKLNIPIYTFTTNSLAGECWGVALLYPGGIVQ